MAPRDPLQLEDQLCFALYNASRAVTRAYAPLLEPLAERLDGHAIALPQHQQHQVLRIGQAERIEQRRVRAGQRARRVVQREAQLIVEVEQIARRHLGSLNRRA